MSMKRWYHRRRRRVGASLRESQWLLPLIGAILGIILALAVGSVDRDADPNDWAITVDRARDTMMSILAILFAGLAIVLSLATVTAQTVASRFSLRLLRVHLRGMANKVVIAIFTMTTTFMVVEQARMASLAADDLAPRASLVVSGLLLVTSGLAIIWHINFTLQSIRVDRTIRKVNTSARHAAASIQRQRRHFDTVTEAALMPPPDSRSLIAPDSGYFVRADVGALSELAERHQLTICIDALTGDHMVEGVRCGWVAPAGSDEGDGGIHDQITDTLDVEDSRDPSHDVGFGIRILVDIALMALSPAINDPYTAVQCIDQLAVLFTQIAQGPSGPIAWSDDQGTRRVVAAAPTLADYLDEATSQILTYGAGDDTVIKALRQVPAAAERAAATPAD